MVLRFIHFLLIFVVVGVSGLGFLAGIMEEKLPQLGIAGPLLPVIVLAVLLWVFSSFVWKRREDAREKEFHKKVEEIRGKILSETMARIRSSQDTDKKQGDQPATGSFRIDSSSADTVVLFNKESGSEVNEQLSYMLYFMSYNFKAYSAAAFIYDPARRTLTLNCYHSRSMHILQNVQIPFGAGVVGRVASENKLFMSGDLSFYASGANEPTYYSHQESISSVLAVPVTASGNELLGVLLIDSKDKNAFREQDKELMKRFSTIASALIVNIRMSANLEQAARTFRLFYEASHKFSVALKTDDIFTALFNIVPHVTVSCVRMVTIIHDNTKNCFRIQRIAGQKYELAEGMEIPLNPGIYSYAFTKSQAVNIADFQAQGNSRYYRFAPNEPSNPAVRSLIVFPIMGGEDRRCVGLFSVESGEPNIFKEHIEQILTTVIENASVAITRSLLYLKMEKLATTDGLTGLNNHRTFQEAMAREFERARRYDRPLSVLLTDIDHFKLFNDTYGHPVGDIVLREVANCIRKAVRLNDIPARYGGEEFAVIIPESDEQGAAIIAERIRSSVEQCVIVNDGKELRVTISIGCASFPPHACSQQDLIDCADKALYASKRAGRNRVSIYNTEMTMT
ncbi:MAG: diguanylate cyclase [Chitinispirillales bacterium]|jgi:diguanylate cyclase (GGDEF)-like protein|nr:diguanylate cyclase [Chitinispirillales bacterium]